MTTLLKVDSSIFGSNGNAHALTSYFVEKHLENTPDTKVIHRDFADEALPHYDAAAIQAVGESKNALADTLIEEIQQADVVVIGAPMYNFAIPTALKSWFDHIARAKVTFKYTENGPVGLLTGKKVVVVTTRGGQYRDTPGDALVPYLKLILGFLGLDENVEFVYAEGLAMSEHKNTALDKAKTELDKLIV